MADRAKPDPDKQPGFAVGKKVWFKAEFDAARLARQYGHTGTVASKTPDPYVRRLIDFGEGVQAWIPEEFLCLTPPPALTGKTVKPKEAKPPRRKEAILPEFGEETTIFDHLGTT